MRVRGEQLKTVLVKPTGKAKFRLAFCDFSLCPSLASSVNIFFLGESKSSRGRDVELAKDVQAGRVCTRASSPVEDDVRDSGAVRVWEPEQHTVQSRAERGQRPLCPRGQS